MAINNAATTTSLTSNPAGPITQGTPVAFTANITGNPSVGTVSFYYDYGQPDQFQIGSAVNVSGGSATSASTTALPAGSDTITAIYSGGAGFAGSQGTDTLTVNQTTDSPPTITTTTLPNWTVNQPYNQTILATGGTGAITFTVTAGNLPPGLTINSTTGVIAGTPTTTSGSPFNFTITVTDSTGAAASQAYTVTINPAVSITTATPWQLVQAWPGTDPSQSGYTIYGTSQDTNGGQTSQTLGASTNQVTIGNIVLVFVNCENEGIGGPGNNMPYSTVTCTDNAAAPNTYTQLFAGPNATNTGFVMVFAATITSLPTSGNLNPTVSWVLNNGGNTWGGPFWLTVSGAEFSGGSTAIDTSSVAQSYEGGGPAIQPGSMTTSGENDLILQIAEYNATPPPVSPCPAASPGFPSATTATSLARPAVGWRAGSATSSSQAPLTPATLAGTAARTMGGPPGNSPSCHRPGLANCRTGRSARRTARPLRRPAAPAATRLP